MKKLRTLSILFTIILLLFSNKLYAEESIVASVGTEQFSTFDEALSFANTNGGEIKLLDNIEFGAELSSTAKGIATKADVTIDLNGKTLKVLNKGFATTNPETTLTIKDSAGGGIIDGTSTEITKKQIITVQNGRVVIEGGTIKSNAYGIVVYDEKSAEVKGGDIIGESYGIYLMGSSSLEISGGKVGGKSYAGVFLAANSIFSLNGGEVYSEKNYSLNIKLNGQVNLNGGIISGSYGIYSTDGAVISINGTNISSTNYGIILKENSKASLERGNIDSNFGIYSIGNNEVNILGGKINGKNQAIYATGGTINLKGGNITSENLPIYLNNITENIKPVLNVSSGKIENTSSNGVAIRIESTLDNSSVESNISGGEVFGTIFLINEKDEKEGVILNISDNAKITSDSFAIATNGTFLGRVRVNINGGNIVSNNYAVYFPQPGSLNISGGIITGSAGAVCLNRGDLTVTGGTLKSQGTVVSEESIALDGTRGYNSATIAIPAEYDKVSVNITGKEAKFIAENDAEIISDVGAVEAGISKGAIVNITAGIYSKKPGYIANNYTSYKDESNNYVVDEKTNFKNSKEENYIINLDSEGISLDLELENPDLSKYIITESTDSSIVKIENGKAIALKVGKTSITSMLSDEDISKRKTFNISVYEINTISDKSEDIELTNITKDIVNNILNNSNTLLNEEESKIVINALSEGKRIESKILVNELTNLPEKEKNLENELSKYGNILKYYDINAAIREENSSNNILLINDLGNEIEIKIDIPNENAPSDGYIREYKVARIHDDKIDILDASKSIDGKITFKTSKFSTYALLYLDTPIIAENNESESIKDDLIEIDVYNVNTTKTNSNNIFTGDTILFFVLLLIVAIVILSMTLVMRKINKE